MICVWFDPFCTQKRTFIVAYCQHVFKARPFWVHISHKVSKFTIFFSLPCLYTKVNRLRTCLQIWSSGGGTIKSYSIITKKQQRERNFRNFLTMLSPNIRFWEEYIFTTVLRKDTSNPAIAKVNCWSLQKWYFGIETGPH